MVKPINVYHKININHVNIHEMINWKISISLALPGGTQGGYYIGQQPYGGIPLNIDLDGSRQEQRIPLQVLVCDSLSWLWLRFFFLSECSTTIGCLGSYRW